MVSTVCAKPHLVSSKNSSGQTSLVPALLLAQRKTSVAVKLTTPGLWNNCSGYGKFAELEAVTGKHPEYK